MSRYIHLNSDSSVQFLISFQKALPVFEGGGMNLLYGTVSLKRLIEGEKNKPSGFSEFVIRYNRKRRVLEDYVNDITEAAKRFNRLLNDSACADERKQLFPQWEEPSSWKFIKDAVVIFLMYDQNGSKDIWDRTAKIIFASRQRKTLLDFLRYMEYFLDAQYAQKDESEKIELPKVNSYGISTDSFQNETGEKLSAAEIVLMDHANMLIGGFKHSPFLASQNMPSRISY